MIEWYSRFVAAATASVVAMESPESAPYENSAVKIRAHGTRAMLP